MRPSQATDRPYRRRRRLLDRVAGEIPRRTEPVLVAIDGVDGAGKSVLADELAQVLRRSGRPVIRASVDAFHHPQVVRYRRGRGSPVGYWLDSFDYARLRHDLLDPLRHGGSRRYRTASHDVDTDEFIDAPWAVAAPTSVLLLDGVFLHRDELCRYWDLSIFLEVPFQETARRMHLRDGSDPDPAHPMMTRYVEGQRLYLAACEPANRASIVIDNEDWERPFRVGRSSSDTTS